MAQATLDGKTGDTQKTRPAAGGDPFPTLPAEFGRYRVLKLLGRGGMGAVYLAQDSQLGREVALKIPFIDATKSQRLERFAREARSAAALKHPNICTVFDAGEIGGRPFLTMEYVAGTPLEQEIGADVLMPQARAAEVVRKVALALEYAHRKGTIHRDLKPANIMMAADGEPVVIDFGLAKQVADVDPDASKLTADGGVLGTPTYMSPEQVRGDAAVGPASDVYALGVVLFELLTGAPPYTGSLGAVMGQILTAPVPPVREFRADADPRLDAVCQRAMAKAPADRFRSMAEFASALGDYLSSPSLPAPSEPRPPARTPVQVSASESAPFDELDRTTEPTRVTVATGRAPKERSWRRPAAVALALALLLPLGVWLASVVLRVETPNGTLVVEINDPAVEARIKDGKLILSGPDGKDRYTLAPGERDKKIDAGPYKIRVEGADGLMLNTPEFTLKKGDRVTVRVTVDPKAVAKKDAAVGKEPQVGGTDPAAISKETGFAPLFNGKDLTGWLASDGTPAGWEVKDGYLVVAGTKGIRTNKDFGPRYKLHLEFWLPLMAKEGGQDRANSGIFLQGRHEIHLIDSYRNDTLPDGAVGSMYGLIAADKGALNKAVRPPETWNTLEMTFLAPRADTGGQVTEAGRVTVILNGVTVINDEPFDKVTMGAVDNKVGVPGPIALQNRGGNKVRYRNIEIKELPPDPFQENSVWSGVHNGVTQTLTVTERKGEQFKARFLNGNVVDREVSGTVKGGKVIWLAKDVRVIKGGSQGGDNKGTFTKDMGEDALDFVYYPAGGTAVAGTFVLRLKPDK